MLEWEILYHRVPDQTRLKQLPVDQRAKQGLQAGGAADEPLERFQLHLLRLSPFGYA